MLFLLEAVDKLCGIWLNTMKDLPGLDRPRANIKNAIPEPGLILDTKLCLVYDFWTGNPWATTEDIKSFIDEVFPEVDEVQKLTKDLCMQAAEDRKDPFRSEIWDIASRSTISERILNYCTSSLKLLGEKTSIETVVDEYLAGHHKLLSVDNPIYAVPGCQAVSDASSGLGPSTRACRSSRAYRSHTPWTRQEVALLRAGIARHGQGRWSLILRDHAGTILSRRSPTDLKDKWRNLCRRKGDDQDGMLLVDAANRDAPPPPRTSGKQASE